MAPQSKTARKRSARSYQSTVRTRGAVNTRTNILDTAMRLFLERGYAKVTVGDIAAEASLALPTVYASTGVGHDVFRVRAHLAHRAERELDDLLTNADRTTIGSLVEDTTEIPSRSVRWLGIAAPRQGVWRVVLFHPSRPRRRVSRIDRCCLHADPHLPRPRTGLRQLQDTPDVWTTKLRIAHCFHARPRQAAVTLKLIRRRQFP